MVKRDTTKLLAWFLRLMGTVELIALAAVVMPTDTMAAIHFLLGLGEMPRDPVFGYLARSCSAFYAMTGALMLCLSIDVRRNRHIIRFLAMIMMVFGLALLIIDVLSGLPTWWCAVEGPGVVILASMMALFARHVPESASPALPGEDQCR